MEQPISYLLNGKSPLDAFMGGVQQYQTMENNDLTNQSNMLNVQRMQRENQAQAQLDARHQQAVAALQGLDVNDMEALKKYNLQYGDLPVAKNAQTAFSQLQTKEQQNLLGEMSKNISLFSNGRSDLVINNARAKAAAYQQSGNAAKAKEYSDFADFAANDSNAAHKALLMTYANVSGDKTGGNLKAYGEALGPKVETTDGGDAVYRGTYDPLTGAPITDPKAIVKKGNTPDAVLNNQTSLQTTGMNNNTSVKTAQIGADASNRNAIIGADAQRYSSDQSARASMYGADQSAAASRYGTDQNNNTKRLEIGQNGQIEWYKANTERQKAQQPKPMTEAQANANLFGTRMQEANKIINALESKGVHTPMLASAGGGAGETVANILPSFMGGASAEQGQYMQAKRDFINAVLRKESGAAIGKDEFASAEKQYFPQPGDSHQVVMQKAANRRLAGQLIYQASGQTPAQGGGTANHSDLFH